MTLKELMCYIRAIPLWAKKRFNKDFFCPHFWVEKEVYHHNIWVSDNNFRIAEDSLHHYPGEHFVANARLTGLECKRCGKKMMEWDKGDVIILPKE